MNISENDLEKYPDLAKKIQQAESTQQGRPTAVNFAPEQPRSNEQARPYVSIPKKSETSPRRPIWHYATIVAMLVLAIVIYVHHGGQVAQAAYLQATSQHIAQVTSPLSDSPVASTPQPTPAQPIASQASDSMTSTPVSSQPAETVGDYYDQMGTVGNALTITNRGLCTFRLPGGVTLTAQGTEACNAIFKLPLTVAENQSRPPITGQIANNDLSVTLEVSGPNGVKTIQGKIDSGTVKSAFPESFLQSIGYTPVSSQAVLGVTGQQTEGVYDVPDIQIQGNDGQWENLYPGDLQVWGDQFNEALIGADVLQKASLSVNGSTFVLGFPN